MKLTILVDNNTIVDRFYLGEPALSVLIEAENKKILLDTGYSDVFLKNAAKMNINLLDIDELLISHGHNDHTMGLIPYIKYIMEKKDEDLKLKKPILRMHPYALIPKIDSKIGNIGMMISEKELNHHFKVIKSTTPVHITERLVFLGEIERQNDYEKVENPAKTTVNEREVDDILLDDTALVYKSHKGLVIITGCSHSGICNICSYAKKVCEDDRIIDIIGGLHLQNPPSERLNKTIRYLKDSNVKQLHACHCTDLKSKIAIGKEIPVIEVGAGMVIKFNE